MTAAAFSLPPWVTRLWPLFTAAAFVAGFLVTRETRLVSAESTIHLLVRHDSAGKEELGRLREGQDLLLRRQCVLVLDFELVARGQHLTLPMMAREAAACTRVSP